MGLRSLFQRKAATAARTSPIGPAAPVPDAPTPPELQEELLEAVESEDPGEGADGDYDPDQDDLLADAIATVVQMGTASTSMLQRRMRVGYTRAGRLIDMMERRGVISGYEGSKARQVLITEADLPRVLEALGEPAVAGPVED